MKGTAIGRKINPLKLPKDNILGWPFYSRSWDKVAQQISAWNYVYLQVVVEEVMVGVGTLKAYWLWVAEAETRDQGWLELMLWQKS